MHYGIEKIKTNNDVLFIDASKEYLKSTNNNKLSKENIANILNYYKQRKNIQYISKLTNIEQIKENAFNLSVSTYVEKENVKEIVDIKILNKEIEEIVAKNNILRKEIDLIIKDIENE